MIGLHQIFVVFIFSVFIISEVPAQNSFLQELVSNTFLSKVPATDNTGKKTSLISISSLLIVDDTTGVYGDRCAFQDLSFIGYSMLIHKSWKQADIIENQAKDSLAYYHSAYDDNNKFLFRYKLFTIDRKDTIGKPNLRLNTEEELLVTKNSFWAIDSMTIICDPVELSNCIVSYHLELFDDKKYHQEFKNGFNHCADQNQIRGNAPFYIDSEPVNVQYDLNRNKGLWRTSKNVLFLLGDQGGVICQYQIIQLDKKKLILSPSKGQIIYMSKKNKK